MSQCHSLAEVAALSPEKHDVPPHRGVSTPTTTTAAISLPITTATTTTTTAIKTPITTARVKPQTVSGAENGFIRAGDRPHVNSAKLQDFLDKTSNICASCEFILNKNYTRLIPLTSKNQATIKAMTRFFELRSELESFDMSVFLLCEELQMALSDLPLDEHSRDEAVKKANDIIRQAKKLSELTSSLYVNLQEIKNDADPKVKEYTKLTLTIILMQVLTVVLNALATVAFFIISPALLLYYSIASGVSTAGINTYRAFKNRSQTNKVNEWDELEKHFSTLRSHLSEMEVGIMIELQGEILGMQAQTLNHIKETNKETKEVMKLQQEMQQEYMHNMSNMSGNMSNMSGELSEVKRKLSMIANTSDANTSSNDAQTKRIKQLEEESAETKRQMEMCKMYNQIYNQKVDFLTYQIAQMAANGGMSRPQHSEVPRFAVPKEFQSSSASPEPLYQQASNAERLAEPLPPAER